MMTTNADVQLLEGRSRRGDPAAFGQLLRLWDADLRGVAWSVVRSGPSTDDVKQNAYERAFRSIDRFEGKASMKTWLHSIVYRAAIDHIRFEGRRSHEDVTELRLVASHEPQAQPESAAVSRSELASVLQHCSPDQRAMLMLTAGLGYSFDETAEILGENRGTVASRVGRLRKRLSRWEEDH
ncbi:MAG: RNA polymerase sigma factor [Acidimicrobiia bacterium]|nr:RNA polymerase sigma factor [Acidimicrobiia bacterium]